MTAQQLKNSILQMAVQGKLVPQDPNDEPASFLLERIRKEKEELIRQGKIKREKNPSVIFRGADNIPYEKVGKAEPVSIADEVPFEIPESWEWVRLGSVIELQSGQDLTPDMYNAVGRGIPYITGASNIENDKVLINRWTEAGRAFAYRGDLLLTCKGTVGTMAFLQEEQVHIARQIMAVRMHTGMLAQYIRLVLDTLVVQLKSAAKSMIPGISRDDVLNALIPVPPMEEQNRIVTRFYDIVPILEVYENAETELCALNNGFPDCLKKSILQMAVQGKLVHQDPTDEPAEVLLARIREEKQRLVKEGKIKKDKHESIIFRRDNSHYEKSGNSEVCIDDTVPFELPNGWQWERLINLFNFIDYRGATPTKISSGVPLVTAKNIKKGFTDYSIKEYIAQSEFETRQSRGIPKRGDILFTTEAPMGNIALADLDVFSAGQRLITLQQYTDTPILNNQLFVYFILSDAFQKQLLEQSTGTTVKGIKAEKLKRLFIPVPPLSEQNRIVDAIIRCYWTIDGV